MRTAPSHTLPSLYRRLGGYDIIAAIIADLFRRLKEDPRFVRFGLGRSIDSKARVLQLTIEQICALSGGPCSYLGRDMKSSHHGLGITEEEWQANLELAADTLDNHGILEPERKEFLELFERFHDQIVEQGPISPRFKAG